MSPLDGLEYCFGTRPYAQLVEYTGKVTLNRAHTYEELARDVFVAHPTGGELQYLDFTVAEVYSGFLSFRLRLGGKPADYLSRDYRMEY